MAEERSGPAAGWRRFLPYPFEIVSLVGLIGAIAFLRGEHLSGNRVQETSVIEDTLAQAARADINPDIVVWLSVHSPLRRATDVQKAWARKSGPRLEFLGR